MAKVGIEVSEIYPVYFFSLREKEKMWEVDDDLIRRAQDTYLEWMKVQDEIEAIKNGTS